VRVELPGKQRYLHLAEVQVFSGGQNVALKGTAKQSSTDFGGDAKRAIDGNTNGDYNANSVCHTGLEDNPWWEVNLGQEMPVEKVVLWNRTDGGDGISSRMKGYRLVLYENGKKQIDERKSDGFPNPKTEYAFDGVRESPEGRGRGLRRRQAVHGREGHPARVQGRPRGRRTVQAPGYGRHPRAWSGGDPGGRPGDPEAAGSRTLEGRCGEGRRVPPLDRAGARADARPGRRGEEADGRAQARDGAGHEGPARESPAQDADPDPRKLPGEGEGSVGGRSRRASPVPENEPKTRLGLARWLVSPENPLTARIVANRHWEQLFGAGLVSTSEDWGVRGEMPSHPELLDWLAVELVRNQWDLKKFVKLIVTSATYRQTSMVTPS
jgi:hypothetical protein